MGDCLLVVLIEVRNGDGMNSLDGTFVVLRCRPCLQHKQKLCCFVFIGPTIKLKIMTLFDVHNLL